MPAYNRRRSAYQPPSPAEQVDALLMQHEEQRLKAEQQEQQRADQAQRQEQAQYREAEQSARQEDARRVRAWKQLGAQTQTDVATGRTTVAQHEDGTVKSKVGPQGAPEAIDTAGTNNAAIAASILGGGDSGALGASGGAIKDVVGQRVRNDRWQESYVKPDARTDPRGVQYVTGTDPQTGMPTKQAVGIDEKAYDEANRAAAVKQQSQEISLKQNQLDQAKMRFMPQWEPVKKGYQATLKELEEVSTVFKRDGKSGKWMKEDKDTGMLWPVSQNEVAAWQQKKQEIETRHGQFKTERDKLLPQYEQITAQEREAAEEKLLVDEDASLLKLGLPPKDRVSELYQASPDGTASAEEVAKARLKDLGVANPTSQQIQEQVSMEIRQNRETAAAAKGGITWDQGDWRTALAKIDTAKAKVQRDLSVGEITPEEADKRTQFIALAENKTVERVQAEAKIRLETKARDIAASFIGTGTAAQSISQNEPSGLKITSAANEYDKPEEWTAEALRANRGDIEAAIKWAQDRAKGSRAPTPASTGSGLLPPMIGGSMPGETASAQPLRQAAERLTQMKAAMDKAGVAPKDRPAIIQDAARIHAWTEKDTDNIRKLSTGDLVINPGRVFGQKEALIAEINASDTTPAAKAAAVKRLDAMRGAMAGKIFRSTVRFDDDFEEYAKQQYQAGNKDQAAILDSWSAQQKDRNWLFKAADAVTEGVKTGSVGISKTIIGGTAGMAALFGADATAARLGQQAVDVGGLVQGEKEAAKLRGMTGGYAIASDLIDTVAQMTPMIAGGNVAGAMKGFSAVAMRGASVYGWAAAQGYESKLSDAVDMAAQGKGSALTADEIAGVLGSTDTQVAAFLNGAQTAILAAAFPRGAEAGALGKVSANMTISDFLRKGGVRAIKDGTLRQELKAIGKNIFLDAKDEALEEFSNQVLDGMISVAALNKDMRLGDLLEDSFKAGALGGLVGGGMPQFYRGQTKQQKHQGMVQSLAEQMAGTPDVGMVRDALALVDPRASKTDEAEVKQARQLVNPQVDTFKALQAKQAAYDAAIKAKDYKGAAAIDAEIDADFTAAHEEHAQATAKAVMLNRELTGMEETAKEKVRASYAQVEQARMTGDKQAIAQAEAAHAIVAKEAQAVPLTRAAVKIASGMSVSSLTDAEMRSVGIKIAPGGKIVQMTGKELANEGLTKPLVRVGADGSPILLDEAIEQVAGTVPAAAEYISMGEQAASDAAQARFDAAQQSPAPTGVPTDSLPDGQGATPGGAAPQSSTPATNEPNPQGAPGAQTPETNPQSPPADPDAPGGMGGGQSTSAAATPQAGQAGAAVEAAVYEAARQQDPSLPEIPARVTEAFSAGQPVSVSMQKASGIDVPEGYTRQGNVWAPPAGQTVSPARTVAEQVKERVLASMPKLQGRLDIVEESLNSGGADLNIDTGGIRLSLADIERAITRAKGDTAAVIEYLENIVARHEAVHVVQVEALRAQWEAAGSPGKFSDYFLEFYSTLHGELISKEAEAAARKIYGEEAWDRIQAKGKGFEAAEFVRMLVEAKLSGNSDQFSELFRAIKTRGAKSKLAKMIRKAIEILTGMKLSAAAQEHVVKLEELYSQLTTPVQESAAKPQESAKSAENSAKTGLRIAPNPTGNTARILNGDEVLWEGPASEAKAELANLQAAQESPMKLTGDAIKAATEQFPKITRGKLAGFFDEILAEVEALPAGERMAGAQRAVADRINAIADAEAERTGKKREEIIEGFRAVAGKRAAKQAASIEQAVVGSEAPEIPAGKQEKRDTPNSEMTVDVVSTFVDLDQLVGSSDPLFPGGALQPRNRSTQASQNQREEMVQNIRDKDDQHRRYLEGATTDSGRMVVAPLFGADGKQMTSEDGKPLFYVISGNGRRNALREAANRNVSGKVMKGFRETAAAEGIDVEGMTLPVPVSIFVPKSAKEAIDLAEYSNRDAQLSVSNTEQANRDAASIEKAGILKLWEPDASGDAGAASNRDFVRAFARAVGDEGIIDGRGALTDEGAKRIERAMVATLLGPEQAPLLDMLFNRSGDLGLRAILGGVASESGSLLKLAAAKPDFDLSPVLADALKTAVEAKAALAAGEIRDVGEFFDQGNLFESTEQTPERQLARAIVESRSRKAIREILGAYRRGAEAVDTGTMSMFAEAETTLEDLILAALDARPIDQVVAEVAAEFGQNADLPAKLRVVAVGIKKLPLDQRKAMNGAIGAEVERLRDGVVSAPEWQRLNPDALTPMESLFQRFLDSNTPQSIGGNMGKILAPRNQAVLASSPATEWKLIDPKSMSSDELREFRRLQSLGFYRRDQRGRYHNFPTAQDVRTNNKSKGWVNVVLPKGESERYSKPGQCHSFASAILTFRKASEAVTVADQNGEIFHSAVRLQNTEMYVDSTAVYFGKDAFIEGMKSFGREPFPKIKTVSEEELRKLVPGDPRKSISWARATAVKTVHFAENLENSNTLGSSPAPDRPSLGIQRKDMPQIRIDVRGKFRRWMEAEGVRVSIEEINPNTLTPSQADLWDTALKGAHKHTRTRNVIVSADGYILDGHHQWKAAQEKGKTKLPVVVIDLPARDALAKMHEFEKVDHTALPGTQYENEEYQYGGKAPEDWRKSDLAEARIVNPIDPDLSPDEKTEALIDLAMENVPLVEQILSNLRDNVGVEGKYSIKLPERIQGKASRPSIRDEAPWHDIEHVRDGLRFKVTLTHFNQIEGIVQEFAKAGIEIIKFDTKKMFAPKEWGWRFIGFDMRMPNGQLVEFYAPLGTMDQKAVKEPNHLLFEKWRNVPKHVWLNDPVLAAERAADVKESRDRYDAAFMAGIEAMGLTYAEAEALFNNLVSDAESVISSQSDMGPLRTPSVQMSGSETRQADSPARMMSARPSPGNRSLDPRSEAYAKGLVEGFEVEDTADKDGEFTSTDTKSAGSKQDISGSSLQSSPAPELDLFGGIEAQITGPRAKVKRNAAAALRKAPEQAKPNVAKAIAKAEGLQDLDLFAAAAVKNLDAKPRKSESAIDDSARGQSGNPVNPRLYGGQPASRTRGTGTVGADQDLFDFTGRPSGKPSNQAGGATAPDVQGPQAGLPGSGDGSAATNPDLGGGRPGTGRPPGGNEGGNADSGNAGKRRLTERQRPAEGSPDRNFSIGENTVLAEGGAITRLRNNLAAIDLLRQLETEGRNPTVEEKAVLAKYVGWGGIPQVFDEEKARAIANGEIETRRETAERYKRNFPGRYQSEVEMQETRANELEKWKDKWGDHYAQLEKLLTPDEWESARDSTINAHYTSPTVINGMWDAVERMGFRGGNVLEPAGGVGHFFGLMPPSIANRSRMFGVELDSVSGRIFAKLYPEAEIEVTGFQDSTIPDNSQDLTISNVPFANITVSDAYLDAQAGAPKFNLHNYFFERALRKTRPGGIVAFITTANTMDAQITQRKWLAERADFMGAIRLPNDAFKGNANTQVVTDIIFLRKPDGSPNPMVEERWTSTRTVGIEGGGSIEVNEYFARHPEMILGRLADDGSMYGGKKEMTVHSTGDLAEQLRAAVERLPENVVGEGQADAIERLSVENRGAKDGAFIEENGKLRIKGDSEPIPVKEHGKVRAFMKLRDTLNDLYAMESDPGATDAQIAAQRAALNRAYDGFKAVYKLLHESKNKKLLETDPDFYRTLGLEVPVGEKKILRKQEFRKADVFTRRVLEPRVAPETAENIDDALLHSFRWKGRLDTRFIGKLLGITVEEAETRLLATEHAYRDPASGKIEHATTYLAGNVRKKLRDAEFAAQRDASMQRNVDALRAALPEDVGWADISFKMGSAWIPAETYERFLTEKLFGGRSRAQVIYNKGVGDFIADSFIVQQRDSGYASSIDTQWGTPRKSATEIAEALLNQRDPRVTRTVDKKSVYDPEATEMARAAASRMADAFQEWVAGNVEVQEQLHRIYNESYNSHVVPTYDGSFMQLPWVSKDFDLYPDKKHVVWRALQEGTLLVAHGVGGGKTIIGTAIAMEARRLGLAKKPLIVVHNATLEQFATTITQMAPTARVLVARKEDLAGPKRKEFMGRVRSGDWDAVVMAHSTFDLIPDDPAWERQQITDLIGELEDAIREQGGDPNQTDLKKIKDPSVKELVKMRTRLRDRMSKLQDRRTDDVLNFQELGIDAMIIDEVHRYKKQPFVTRQSNIAGIDTGFSKRGSAMQLRAKWVQAINQGRGVFTMTGTPVTNTLGESWNMVRLVRPDLLKEFGVQTFDRFVSTFGNILQSGELRPNGQYKPVTRLSQFTNIPEWNRFWGLAADVKMGEDMNVKGRPRIKGGKAGLTAVERTPQVKAIIDEISRVIDQYDAMTGKEKQENRHIPLLTYAAARMAAIDVRLINPEAKDEAGSKVNTALKNVMRLYGQTTEHKGTQVIFSDSYRPLKTTRLDLSAAEFEKEVGDETGTETDEDDGGFNLYHDMREKLVKAGVPRSEIAIISEAKNDKQREALFARVNSGEIRIIMGSTETLGTGVNMQQRMIAAHHLDVPWTPAGLEQRDGRVYRQGNMWAELGDGEIEIMRYGMKDTLDAALWQKLETKERMIKQAVSGKVNARVIEDDAGLLNYMEQKAALSGADGMLKFELDEKVRQLKNDQRAHRNRQFDLQRATTRAQGLIEEAETSLPNARRVAKVVAPLVGVDSAEVEWTFEDGETLKGEDARKALDAIFKERRKKAGAIMNPEKAESVREPIHATANGIPMVIEYAGISEDLANAANPDLRWNLFWFPRFETEKITIYPSGSPHPGSVINQTPTLAQNLAVVPESIENRRAQAEKDLTTFADEMAKPFAKQADFGKALVDQAVLYRRMGMGYPESPDIYQAGIGENWETVLDAAVKASQGGKTSPRSESPANYPGKGLAPAMATLGSSPVDSRGNPQGIDTISPGGANIGDAAQPDFSDLSPAALERNAAAWSEAWSNGYDSIPKGEKWESYSKKLIIFKERLLKHLVGLANASNWKWGVLYDVAHRGNWPWVVYFETPAGQISFHWGTFNYGSYDNGNGPNIIENLAKTVGASPSPTLAEYRKGIKEKFPYLSGKKAFKEVSESDLKGEWWHTGPHAYSYFEAEGKKRFGSDLGSARKWASESFREWRAFIRKIGTKSVGLPVFDGEWDGEKGTQAKRLAALFENDNAAKVSRGGVSGQESASPTRFLARGQEEETTANGFPQADFNQSPPAASGATLGSSPESSAAQVALAKMPAIYRQVFEAVQGGASVPEVMERFPAVKTPRAVENILNQVRSRIATAAKAGSAEGLAPAMQGDKIKGGRPDLALGANPRVAAVDQIRNESGLPDERKWAEVNRIARDMLVADYQGTYDAMLAKAKAQEVMSDVEVAATKLIIARETIEGAVHDAAGRMKLAMLIHGYRDIGTETARSLAIRRDPEMTPAERHAQFIAEALLSPDAKTRARMRKKPESVEAILQRWMSRVDQIEAELLAQGIDIREALANFQEEQQARKEAEAESPETAAIIDTAIRKLNRQEKMVIEAIRGGALVTKAAFITGLSTDEVKQIYTRFMGDIRSAMAEAAKKYLANSLASSPMDPMSAILTDLGLPDLAMIDDTAEGFVDRRNEKPRKPRKPREPKAKEPKKPKAPKPDGVELTPEQQARLDEAWERFLDAPPNKQRIFWQEEAGIFLWTKEQFHSFMQKTEGIARDWSKMKDLLDERQEVSTTTGTFDLHDPVAMAQVADAFTTARGGKMDALMEYWRMSILSGPQTHNVNILSTAMNIGFHLGPRRVIEAMVNSLIRSEKGATFGEFKPMSRQIAHAWHLASRNALRSWQLDQRGGRVFESYAQALAVQMDFTGQGAEYIPPALGGKIGKVMRSISFRALQTADTFLKSFYAQIDVAAQAHRIASAEEKLKGKAYDARVADLMVPGSIAWIRAMEGAKYAAFQKDMAFEGMGPQQAMEKARDESILSTVDAAVRVVQTLRSVPFLGRIATFFLPYLVTPANINKQAIEYTPLGGFIAVADGIRALRRRVFAGELSKAEAAEEAAALYDKARLVQDVTNQTIAFAALIALAGLAWPEDDEELPWITGTSPYKSTNRGERDNAYAVMPPMSLRLPGGVVLNYGRFEPASTSVASMVDLIVATKRHGGITPAAIADWSGRFKDRIKDQSFMMGLSNLLNAVEDPDRWGERLAGNIVTGFVPNLLRQPIRESDTMLRDQSPREEDGFFTSLGKRLGYSMVPQFAPVKQDVWGDPIRQNRGQTLGNRFTDAGFRILDPTNLQLNPQAKPIDRWIFQWNRRQADSKDRIAIEPIDDKISGRLPGEKNSRVFPLTREEQAEANRTAGSMALEMLGEDWQKTPLTEENAQRILDTVRKSQRIVRAEIREKKLFEAFEAE